MKHQDYINDFFIFLLKTDPDVVIRILNDLKTEGKCGKAPELSLKIIKKLRRGEIIKKLATVNKKDLFSFLLSASSPDLLDLITDLVKELAAAKVQGCRTPQVGGKKAKKSPKKPKKSPKKYKKSPKRKSPCVRDKVAKVMGEFKRGKLKTSSGMKVKNRSQAIAIALSIGDRSC